MELYGFDPDEKILIVDSQILISNEAQEIVLDEISLEHPTYILENICIVNMDKHLKCLRFPDHLKDTNLYFNNIISITMTVYFVCGMHVSGYLEC